MFIRLNKDLLECTVMCTRVYNSNCGHGRCSSPPITSTPAVHHCTTSQVLEQEKNWTTAPTYNWKFINNNKKRKTLNCNEFPNQKSFLQKMRNMMVLPTTLRCSILPISRFHSTIISSNFLLLPFPNSAVFKSSSASYFLSPRRTFVSAPMAAASQPRFSQVIFSFFNSYLGFRLLLQSNLWTFVVVFRQ